MFGPTAAGKTAFSLELAERLGADIFNADSRQVYQQMPIITACPQAADYARVRHHVFEFLPPSASFSVMDYMAAVRAALAHLPLGVVPLFVGGTGFYMDVLQHGLSPMPAVPADITHTLEHEWEKLGAEKLHAQLTQIDPVAAAACPVGNKHRLLRALGIYRATGTAITQWRQLPKTGGLEGFRFVRLAVLPPREILYTRIHSRFAHMLQNGLLNELRELMERGYDETLPALTGLGIPELFAHLRGECSVESACEKTLQHMRNYAKRQTTWVRNHYHPHAVFDVPDAEKAMGVIHKQGLV